MCHSVILQFSRAAHHRIRLDLFSLPGSPDPPAHRAGRRAARPARCRPCPPDGESSSHSEACQETGIPCHLLTASSPSTAPKPWVATHGYPSSTPLGLYRKPALFSSRPHGSLPIMPTLTPKGLPMRSRGSSRRRHPRFKALALLVPNARASERRAARDKKPRRGFLFVAATFKSGFPSVAEGQVLHIFAAGMGCTFGTKFGRADQPGVPLRSTPGYARVAPSGLSMANVNGYACYAPSGLSMANVNGYACYAPSGLSMANVNGYACYALSGLSMANVNGYACFAPSGLGEVITRRCPMTAHSFPLDRADFFPRPRILLL